MKHAGAGMGGTSSSFEQSHHCPTLIHQKYSSQWLGTSDVNHSFPATQTRAYTRQYTPPPPCPTNALPNEHFHSSRIFWDPIHEVLRLGTELISYQTACPTNTPRAVFFEDFIVCWTRGGGGGKRYTC